MELSARTDIGNKRAENQDSYRAQAHTDGKAWLAVCDGMGGARGGRLASGLAVASIEQVLCAGLPGVETDKQARALLEQAVRSANEAVYEKSTCHTRSPRHGHHGGVRRVPRRHAAVCACRRFPHLSVPWAFHLPAHEGPFHRAGAGGAGIHHRRGGGFSPAQEPHHPRFGRGPAGRGGFWRNSAFPQATFWCCARMG